MRAILLIILFLAATTAVCPAADAPAKPEPPAAEKPAGSGENDAASDDAHRGIIPSGGADSHNAVLAAFANAFEAKDADAIWRLIASETRRELTREIAWIKMACVADAKEGKADFLGKSLSPDEICAYPVPQAFFIIAQAGQAAFGCESQARMMWYHVLSSVGGAVRDAAKIVRLAETVEKDGTRADIFARTPDGVDVHLWFVKEAGKWFFHSPRECAPPAVKWLIPDYSPPKPVKLNLDTPVDALKSFAAATEAANLDALFRCLSEAERMKQGERAEQLKKIAQGAPTDQEHVYSSFFGLTWGELKSLSADKIIPAMRVSDAERMEAEIRARPLLEAKFKEIESTEKKATIEAEFPKESGYPPERFILVREDDGWKITGEKPKKGE